MKIALNALSANAGGGLTYLINLLPALDRVDKKNQYLVLVPEDCPIDFSQLSSRFQIIKIHLFYYSPICRGLYEQCMLPLLLKKHKIDILYSPADMTTLMAPCPVVLALRNPNLYTDMDLGWRGKYYLHFFLLKVIARLSIKKADRIIFVSRSSLSEICPKLGIDQEKTVVIHHGIGHYFSKSPPSMPPSGISLPDRYILAVSTIYRYKNYLNLIKAYQLLISRHPECYLPLLIAGGNADNCYYKDMINYISGNGLNDKVILLGNMDYPKMPEIYSRAALFVFPSCLETFGHPSLEALASSVPVAASDLPVMREVLKEAAVYFDPLDIEGISSKMLVLLRNKKLCHDLCVKGKSRLEDFSWDKTALKTVRTFQAAVKDNTRLW